MDSILFNVDFNRWPVILLSIIPGLINIIIFIYSYFTFNKSKQNNFFLFFVLLVGFWQMTEGMLRLSRTVEAAREWFHISEVIILFVIPFGVLFVLRFTGYHKKLSSTLVNALLFLPQLFFFIAIEARLDKYALIKSDFLYWIVNPQPTLITSLMNLWISLGGIAMFMLPWKHYLKTRKNSSLFLAIGLTVPIMSGIICEIFYPLVLKYNDVPVTAPLVTIFSISAVVAIKKYNLMDYSPKRQWQRILEAMNEGVLIVDNEDRIMYANKMFCKMTEYEFDEMKGKVAANLLLDAAQKHKIMCAIEERKEKISGQYELELITKTGRRIWVLVSGSPYLDSKGNVTGSIGIQTDITKLKETEKLLRHNESRLKNAQSVAHLGSWEMNFATSKASWSDEACKIYGIPIEEKDNQSFESWIKFIHPEDLCSVKSIVKKAKADLSDSSFNHRIICPDGSVKHIHSVSKFEFDKDGHPVGLFGICHDITVQKEMEESLYESEENVKTFINKSLLSIYFVDPNTKQLIYANPTFLEMIGCKPDEVKAISIYDFIDHSKENIDTRINEIKEKRKVGNDERRWKRKDGKIIDVLVSSFYMKRNGTETIYVAASDITHRKKVEQTLQETNQELETFVYKAAHDLRGPLASVLGLINVSRLVVKDETAITYLDMINTAAGRLDYILSELVKAMLMKNAKEFDDEIDFDSLIKSSLERLGHYENFSRLNIDVSISVSGLISNKFIIDTIFQNIIENAVKYQNLYIEKPLLRIRVTEESDSVMITVEDNGIGIEQSVQQKIFDMYFRGTQKSNGSGLGLYLVKKGVEKLKGEISIQSEIGKGSKFMILLPAVSETAEDKIKKLTE